MSHNKDTFDKLGRTIDDVFYDTKSLFYITEFIQVLDEIRKPEKLPNRTKQIITFEIFVKYTQLMESFAALINAFEESNKNNSNTKNIVNYIVSILLNQH